MTFNKQSRYRTDDAKELARQLVALENAVEQALKDAKAETFPRSSVVQVNGGDKVTARVGGYYVCDTQLASIILFLEKPKQADGNSFLLVEKTNASNSVTLVPLDSTIDSSATGIVLGDAAGYNIFCNGVSYRRQF